MKSILKMGAKIFSFAFILFPGFYITDTGAQVIRPDLCKQFLEAKQLYLLNNTANTAEFETSSGASFTLEKLVQENWPEKEIIKINQKEYDHQKDVTNKFHISIMTFTTSLDYVEQGSIDGIILQQGKTGRRPSNTLYWINLNFKEISEGTLAERLIFAVQNMKDMLKNSEDKSIRNTYYYKAVGFPDCLKSNTLYFKKSNLNDKLQTTGAIKEIYPYPFKIVSDEEWVNAIKGATDDVLFVEFIRGGNYTAMDIYKAKGGKILFSSYPWTDLSISKPFLKKILKKD